ncbi:Hypothetical protein GSB_22291 [Giardia duodenalis]|uniref:EamA domain-containing protein n=2 Tax=Giardia intestinalis TaxID=5741 RepID=C6LVG7_GIAIB|nr:Hypothetical protein GL50581_2773 [Giardia intestinalis ATCC 50581]ESU43757.1 Hypothetical protein GSB_22291 [Giardia intestinalis]
MAGKKEKYSVKAIIGIVGMLVFGTGTMVSSKLMLDTSACPVYYDWEYGRDYEPWAHGECPPEVVKKFEKPWFQTACMFMAMLVCIIAHAIIEAVSHNKAKKKAANLAIKSAVSDTDKDTETHSLTQPAETAAKSKYRTWQYWKPYVIIAVPSIFDMIATSVMTMGLVYIDVSVMQMLRGTMVVFATIMNILFLRRRVRLYQWIAIIGTVSACALVGASCILGSMGSTTAKPWNLQIFGCFLVVISQLIQSGQIVAEDFLLSDVDAAPLQVVGMEGFWGLIITVFIVSPLLMWGVSGEDHGANEDFVDTFYMIADNPLILVFVVIYFISILFLNWAGMTVTAETSSVVRTIFEAIRTAAIWVTDLLIYYLFAPNSVYGESWTTYSWMQLAGFLLLIYSSQVYNGYCKYPKIFRYKFEDDGRCKGVFACCPKILAKSDEKFAAAQKKEQEKAAAATAAATLSAPAKQAQSEDELDGSTDSV